MDLDINLRTHPIPGIAEAATDAAFDAESAYAAEVAKHHDLLADDWQDRAHAREAALTAAEVDTNGKRDAKRPPEIHSASIRRAEVLAHLAAKRREVERLDTAARDAIAAELPAAMPAAKARAYATLAAFKDAIAALERTAEEFKSEVNRAATIQHRAAGGSAWNAPDKFGGPDAALSALGHDVNVYELREQATRATRYLRDKFGGEDRD